MTIGDIYTHARRKIGQEQGYLPLRMIGEWSANEVQAVCSELTSNRRDHIQRNLCQLFVDTLCVAHEYYVPLPKVYKELKLPNTIQGNIDLHQAATDYNALGEKLGDQVSKLYSRVAYYHGWAKPESNKALSELIVDVHQTIYAIAAAKKIDLAGALPSFLNSSADHRALAQFRKPHNHVTTPILDTFRKIKDDTVCIYARNSNAWGAMPPPSIEVINKEGLAPFLRQNIDLFARLSRATAHENVDGFLLMLPPELGGTIDALARTVDEVLCYFAGNDPRGVNSISRIGETNWRYEFCGMKYFVQSFGPCYGADNTRYAQGIKQTFIQFVSEAAFHRAVPREKWQQAREAIREKAQDTGQEYDVHGHDADTFVHNKRAGMPPVKWHRGDPSP